MDWDEMAKPWLANDAFLEASLRPVLDGLLDRAGLGAGQRVLDVGCGTGPGIVKAARAVGPDGHVTGVDIAPPLLRRAAERAPPNASFIEGDAGAAAYPEDGFDAIMSNFGTMFFGDTRSAFAHLRSAVDAGAAFDFVVWSGPQVNPWFSVQRRAAVARFPDLPAPDPDGPGPMRFADPGPLVDMIGEIGWRADIDTVDLYLEPPGDVSSVAAAQTIMIEAMALRDVETTEADIDAIRSTVAKLYAEYEEDGVVRIPAQVHYIRARAA